MKKSSVMLRLCLIVCLSIITIFPSLPVKADMTPLKKSESRPAVLNPVTALYVKYNYVLWADRNVTWKSSNTKIASITNSGSINAKKPGWVTFTATDSKGSSVKTKVLILDKNGTVKTKTALKAALASDEVSNITISSKKKTTFTIKKADYDGKTLKINLPKGTIKNYGSFSEITISAIGKKGYTVYSDIESLQLLAPAKVTVAKDTRVEFLDVQIKKKSSTATVNLTVNGNVGEVILHSKTNVNLSGSNKSAYVYLNVQENAGGSSIKTPFQSTVNVFGAAKLTFEGNAGESEIYIYGKDNPTIINRTSDQIFMYDENQEYVESIDPDSDIDNSDDNDDSNSNEDKNYDDSDYAEYAHLWDDEKLGNIVTAISDADKRELDIAKQVVKDNIRSDMTEFEKVLVLHDYIADHVEYDGNLGETGRDIRHPLQSGWAICGSYTQTLNSMLLFAGIECEFVVGPITATNVPHAWSKVKIYGNWYNIDLTWDDTGFTDYDYFGISDERIGKNRSWDREKYHASSSDLDAWDELAKLKGYGTLPRVASIDEFAELFYNKCSVPGSYKTMVRANSSLRIGNKCDAFAYERPDVFPYLGYLRTTGYANSDEIYFISATTEKEFKPAAESSLVVNLVTDLTSGFAVIDSQINGTGDYIMTVSEKGTDGNGFDVNDLFRPYADKHGYFVTSDYNIRGQVKKELVWCTEGKYYIYHIPRNIMQVKSDDNEVNEDLLNDANITTVSTMQELEALIDPLFTMTDYWTYTLSVVPKFECSEDDVIKAFQRIGASHGYYNVQLNPGMTLNPVRVSGSWYSYTANGSTFSIR